jgi:DNA-binding CsgD family transcriptional regulator
MGEDAKPRAGEALRTKGREEMADPMETQSKAAAIAEAQTGKHVLDIVEAQLRKLGATHILVTGLPMPNRPIDGLVHRFRWADERAGGIERSDLDTEDGALMLGLMRNRAFLWDVTVGDMEHSELFASLGGETRVVVVPVTETHPFQAVVMGGGAHLEAGSVELSNLELICNTAFRRLIDLGVLSTQRPGDLSARERRVLELTALGKTASDIAGLLDISQRTVHAHLQNASAKLNASNKTHTVVEALRYGQIRL